MKISNTSLRIKDECLIFTTAKICSNVNKLTRQKKKKLKPSLNSNSETSFKLHMSLWILYFGVFRFKGGWVGIPPFFKGSVTHPNLTAFTHPNAGVFARVLRKQDTGKHSPKSSTMSATLWWRKNIICIPGSKHVTCRLCPDFASNRTATKKRGWHRFHCWTFVFHFVRLQNFHLCPNGHLCSVATSVSCFSLASVFCVSDVWRLIPLIWYMVYRYNAYTWYVT